MKNLLLTFLIISGISVFSQNFDELSKSFLSDLQTKGISVALKNAPKDSLINLQAKQEKIISKYNEITKNLGKLYGYEEVKTENDINCVIIKKYILKFENSPVIIALVYYKANDKWHLHNVVTKMYSGNKRKRL